MGGRDGIDKYGEEAIMGSKRDRDYRRREWGWDRVKREGDEKPGWKEEREKTALLSPTTFTLPATHQALKPEQNQARSSLPQ